MGCKKCGATFCPEYLEAKNKKHVCGAVYCKNCKSYHKAGKDHCYVMPIKSKEEKPFRIIPYDFECTLVEIAKDKNG